MANGEPGGGQEQEFRYAAFISYSHAGDGPMARRLQTALERYGATLRWRRQRRVFRDETNLAANPNLWGEIERAVLASKVFVMLASPESAQSDWVQKEVAAYLNRPAPHLCVVLTRGNLPWVTPDAANPQPAISPYLAEEFARRKSEPLVVDLRGASALKPHVFFGHVAAIVAAILGKDKDEIYGEHIRAQRRGVVALAAVSVAILALAFAASIQYRIAQKRLDQAISVAENINDVIDRRLEGIPGAVDARRELLGSSLKLLDDLKGESHPKALVQRMGVLQRRADVTLNHEDLNDAARAYQLIIDLGTPRLSAGRITDAEVVRGVFRGRLGLGDVESARGNLAAALKHFEDARSLVESAQRTAGQREDLHREITIAMERIASVQLEYGRLDDAIALRRQALAIVVALAKRPGAEARYTADLAQSEFELAYALSFVGDGQEAQTSATNAVADFERALARQPDNAVWKAGLLESKAAVLGLKSFRGSLEGVTGELEELGKEAAQIVDLESTNLDYQGTATNVLTTLADAYQNVGAADVALTTLRALRTQLLALALRFPDAGLLKEHVVAVETGIGDLLALTGDDDAALSVYDAASEKSGQALRAQPASLTWYQRHTMLRSRIAKIRAAQRHYDEALTIDRALESDLRKLVTAHPEHTLLRRNLSVLLGDIGALYEKMGKLDEALEAQTENVRVAEAVTKASDKPQFRIDLSASLSMLAGIKATRGDRAGAGADYARALDIAKQVVAKAPKQRSWAIRASEAASHLGAVLAEMKKYGKARTVLNEALAIAEAQRHAGPKSDADVERQIAACHGALFNLARAEGTPLTAGEAVRTTVGYARALAHAKNDADLAEATMDMTQVIGRGLAIITRAEARRTLDELRRAAAALTAETPDAADLLLAVGQRWAFEYLADPASARTFLTLRREQRPNEGGLRCEVAELDVGEKTDGEQTDRDLDACRAAAGTSAELTFVAAVLRLARADRSQRPRDVRDVLDAVNRLGAQPMSWSFAGLRAVGKTPKGVHLRPFDVLLRTIDGVAPERRSAEVASMLNKLQ